MIVPVCRIYAVGPLVFSWSSPKACHPLQLPVMLQHMTSWVYQPLPPSSSPPPALTANHLLPLLLVVVALQEGILVSNFSGAIKVPSVTFTCFGPNKHALWAAGRINAINHMDHIENGT